MCASTRCLVEVLSTEEQGWLLCSILTSIPAVIFSTDSVEKNGEADNHDPSSLC